MRDKNQSQKPGGCARDQELLEAFLEKEPSLEKEIFLAHASSCRGCRQKIELVNDLRTELAGKLAQVPESPWGRKKSKALRLAARGELERLAGRRASLPPARLFSLPRLASAALVLAAAFAMTLLLNRSSSKHIFRETPRSGQETMSPQGTLPQKPVLFEWSPVAGATRYSFELIDEDLKLLAQGQRSSKTSFTLPPEIVQALVGGRVYVWTIKAYDDEGSELGDRSAEFKIE